MYRRITAVTAASALACALAACQPQHNHNGGASPNPVPPVKPSWPAASGAPNSKQTEVAVLPPPEPPNHCTSVEDPLPSGISVSFGLITGTVYSACEFPEAPIHYKVTLTLLAKGFNGLYLPIKVQTYEELPGFLPVKTPYTVTADDCLPGTYVLTMYVEGLDSSGKHFSAGPETGSDFKVFPGDC